MKKIILIIALLISITSLAESQTRLKFGDVMLKDTLSGYTKFTEGGIVIATSDSIMLGGSTITPTTLYNFNGGIHLYRNVITIISDGDDIDYTVTQGVHKFNDNVVIDSILTLRSSANVIINGDAKEVTVDASFMKITSDDATSTNRTFTLTDGTYSGQVLIIHYFAATNQAEIVDGGSESGLNGTMTFDNLDESLTLIWNGTYWTELSRIDN